MEKYIIKYTHNPIIEYINKLTNKNKYNKEFIELLYNIIYYDKLLYNNTIRILINIHYYGRIDIAFNSNNVHFNFTFYDDGIYDDISWGFTKYRKNLLTKYIYDFIRYCDSN